MQFNKHKLHQYAESGVRADALKVNLKEYNLK